MTNQDKPQGIAALYMGHMAGTIDLAALPLWIGVLMANYRLRPEQAGLTVTLYLAGIVIASVILASRFDRLPRRSIAGAGFVASAACFFIASRLPVSAGELPVLMVLHTMAGLSVGAALSVVHGSIGRTANPHRHFGFANVPVGFLAILMFSILPGQIAEQGGQVIFLAFAVTQATAGLAVFLFYPASNANANANAAALGRQKARAAIPRVAYLFIGGVVCLIINQSMVFSFVERIGVERGFAGERLQIVLVVLGFINLLPGALAAIFQKRLAPVAVGVAGLSLQAILALILTNGTGFPAFAGPVLFFSAIVLFTHTFLFGALSHVDPSGRAVAATPAMMMAGAAIGPVLGGGLVATLGFGGIGWAALALSAIGVTLILLARGISTTQDLALYDVPVTTRPDLTP